MRYTLLLLNILMPQFAPHRIHFNAVRFQWSCDHIPYYALHSMQLIYQQIIPWWLKSWQVKEAAICDAGMDAAGAGQSSDWCGPASAGGPSQMQERASLG